MMNRLLLMIGVLLFFCGCTECNCENCENCICPNETPEEAVVEVIEFEDPLVKSICVAYWDTDNDNELSYEEAAAVSSMGGVFAYKSISTFNELQYFTGLKAIEENTFLGCKQLTSIVLPEEVTIIGDNAFPGCFNLESVHIENTEEFSYDDMGCYNLSKIWQIGQNAFSGCTKLKVVYLGENLKKIEDAAFYNCNALQKVYIAAMTPPSIGEEVFYMTEEITTVGGNSGWIGHPIYCTIYVPNDALDRYKSSWWSFGGNFVEYDFSQD